MPARTTHLSPLNIVILAAGKGTRMVSERPKVLHPLGGKPLLSHVLETARMLNPAKIIVVYGHGGETVRDAMNDPALVWVHQATQLGTGHALQQAAPALDRGGHTLVLYGDVPLIRAATLQSLLQVAVDGVGLLTVTLDDPGGYGRILRGVDGAVTGIVEHRDASIAQHAIQEINTGILVLPTDRLVAWVAQLRNDNAQKEYYLTDVIALAVAEKARVSTCQPGHFREVLGVNSPQQLAELERLYQQEQATQLLVAGVRLTDPARIDVRGELRCGRDVAIDVNCIFEGRVVLGDNVTVDANCVLRDVEVKAGTHIAPFSLLEKSVVGEDCHIGPYARIRPGSELARAAHIGNFVEIKNSQVGEGSKINHLSYVGDATIGQKVNIGAGTITCNYDGAYKHRTIIEDGAFIGSDTQLVAPVRIGRGATIGAGSTVTRDAPPEQLTLSRAKQLSVSGWTRPRKKE